MLFEYIVLMFIFMAALIGFTFWKLVKYYDYELNYKESVIYSIPALITTTLMLVNYGVIRQNLNSLNYSIITAGYFLGLLIIYYILRFMKHKKYIPYKAIVGYILISLINVIIIFNVTKNQINNIYGWDVLALLLLYVFISTVYIGLLLIINIIFLIIKKVTNSNNYKNIKYKISNFSYVNIFTFFLLIVLIYIINYCNISNYNKLIVKQKDIVINYLNEKYPNYEFEIIETIEQGADCFMFGCRTRVFNNTILDKKYNQSFNIYIKKDDLTIYEDYFQEINNGKDKN